MISSLALDSVWIGKERSSLFYYLKKVEDHSEEEADSYLIHEKNYTYFSKGRIPRLEFKENGEILSIYELRRFISNYTTFRLATLRHVKTWIGITGTNGKTTTLYFLEQLVRDNVRIGTIGTLGVRINGELVKQCFSPNTTLPLFELIRAAELCEREKCEVIALEASSIGYVEGRLLGIPFNCMIAHEVSQDHLDYHLDFETYLKIKQEIVQLANIAIVSQRAFSQGLRTKENIVVPTQADVIELNKQCAIEACKRMGLSYLNAELELPPGRYEKKTFGSFQVVIDYAHTPDALERLVKAFPKEKLHLVVGCGGDRDRGKRREMARIAFHHAQNCVFTMDNPRYEPCLQPLLDLQAAAPQALIIPDRRLAIWYVLETAKEGDTIIIAGKGNEKTMLLHHLSVPYSDHAVIEEWANQSQRMTL
ncbi:Mur ligase family protein [Chryseomicrobium palamuruense]|uniref:Mur ligase family protein n=1 Tax=Chryseomicrobium palamuruense TaxID=682973 RepID=A0ABV8UT91_9BACL